MRTGNVVLVKMPGGPMPVDLARPWRLSKERDPKGGVLSAKAETVTRIEQAAGYVLLAVAGYGMPWVSQLTSGPLPATAAHIASFVGLANADTADISRLAVVSLVGGVLALRDVTRRVAAHGEPARHLFHFVTQLRAGVSAVYAGAAAGVTALLADSTSSHGHDALAVGAVAAVALTAMTVKFALTANAMRTHVVDG